MMIYIAAAVTITVATFAAPTGHHHTSFISIVILLFIIFIVILTIFIIIFTRIITYIAIIIVYTSIASMS